MQDKVIDILNDQREKIYKAEACGLVFTNDYEDDEPMFIGDTNAWERYTNLLNK